MSIPLALTIVELFISPILSNEYCGDVVPIPSLPVAGIKTNFVVDIPTLLTPTLEANVGNTGVELMSWLITLNAFTP